MIMNTILLAKSCYTNFFAKNVVQHFCFTNVQDKPAGQFITNHSSCCEKRDLMFQKKQTKRPRQTKAVYLL